MVLLTAKVPKALWNDGNKNGAAQRWVMDALEEQKRLQMKQNNLLLIEGFKSGAPCCLLVLKNNGGAMFFPSNISSR